MNNVYKAAIALAVGMVVLGAAMFTAMQTPEPGPAPAVIDTDANVGKCISAQRVLHQAPVGEAAETCLFELEDEGPEKFDETWKNFSSEY